MTVRRLVLPLIALLAFAIISVNAFTRNSREQSGRRYFWWSGIRLDTDPLNRNQPSLGHCVDQVGNEPCWEPKYIWVDPGVLVKAIILSGFPVFIIGPAVVHGLAHLGVNEVTSFMISMPLLIFVWYYFLAWITSHAVARFRRRLSTHRSGKVQR